MIVLGIDPGPSNCAWALVDCVPRSCHAVVATGEIPADTSIEPLAVGKAKLVCIETPTTVHPRGSKAALIARGRAIAATINVARSLELSLGGRLPCLRLTAREVRRDLCGDGQANDKAVSYWLALLCVMPLGRTNCHARDAIAVAVAGWRKWSAEQPSTLPDGAKSVLDAINGTLT